MRAFRQAWPAPLIHRIGRNHQDLQRIDRVFRLGDLEKQRVVVQIHREIPALPLRIEVQRHAGIEQTLQDKGLQLLAGFPAGR